MTLNQRRAERALLIQRIERALRVDPGLSVPQIAERFGLSAEDARKLSRPFRERAVPRGLGTGEFAADPDQAIYDTVSSARGRRS